MKATDLLAIQHRDVEQLFEQLENVEEGDRRTVREELAKNLAAHATIEQEIFYAAIKEAMRKEVIEAMEEHGMVDIALHKLLTAAVDDEAFEARCKVLKELVQHHVEDEEKELFPRVESVLGDEALNQLGERLAARFEECLERDVRAMLEKGLYQALKIELPQAPAKKAAAKKAPTKSASRTRRAAGTKRTATTKRRPASSRTSTTKRASSGGRKASGSRSSRSGGSSRSRASR
jgi:hemerythrin-like domain-containing protein